MATQLRRCETCRQWSTPITFVTLSPCQVNHSRSRPTALANTSARPYEQTGPRLAARRLKNGRPPTHPIRGPELRALRELRREYPDTPYLFITERGGPIRRAGKTLCDVTAAVPVWISAASAPSDLTPKPTSCSDTYDRRRGGRRRRASKACRAGRRVILGAAMASSV